MMLSASLLTKPKQKASRVESVKRHARGDLVFASRYVIIIKERTGNPVKSVFITSTKSVPVNGIQEMYR